MDWTTSPAGGAHRQRHPRDAMMACWKARIVLAIWAARSTRNADRHSEYERVLFKARGGSHHTLLGLRLLWGAKIGPKLPKTTESASYFSKLYTFRRHCMTESLPSAERMLQPSLRASVPLHRGYGRRSRQLTLPVSASGNTFGHSFRVTTFGESHGKGVGCVIDGVPPRLPITKQEIQVLLLLDGHLPDCLV